MKSLFTIAAAIIMTSAAYAADSGQTTADISSSRTQMTTGTPSYTFANDLTFGTVLLKGGLGDGVRTNFTTWNPNLTGHITHDSAISLNSPFTWATDQDVRNTSRAIGRPTLTGTMAMVNDSAMTVATSLAIHTPLYDTSYGNTEMGQVWGIEPGLALNSRLGTTTYHMIGGASFNWDTNATLNPANMLSYTVKRAPVARAHAGISQQLDNYTVSATYNIVNGIGVNHIDTNAAGIQQDINPVDLSSITLGGSMKITEGTNLTAAVTKGLKTTDGASEFGSSLASFDRAEEMANLAVNVGLTQTF